MQKIIDALLLIALLATISLLIGCSNIKYIEVYKMPIPPAFMTQQCEDITYLNEKNTTLEYFINVTIDNAKKYRKCYNLNDAKSEWVIKTLQNSNNM